MVHAILITALLTANAAGADVRDQLQGVKKEIKEKKLLLRKTAKVEQKVSGELLEITVHGREL